VGDLGPAKVQPVRAGGTQLRTLVAALCYVLLIPAVSVMALLGAVAYFPGPTKAVLGPALRAIASEAGEDGADNEASQALARVSGAENRLSKLEADIAALAAKATEPAGPALKPDDSQVKALIEPVRKEAHEKDGLLAALSALTLARAELLSGNREVALREMRFAQDLLGGSVGVASGGMPAGLAEALAKGSDALLKGSGTAGDWLSLAWHTLAEALVAAQPEAATP